MKNIYIISLKDLIDLLTRLQADYNVFVPYRKGDRIHFGPFDPKRESDIELGGVRQSQPFKSFISPSRDIVMGGAEGGSKPRLIAGVKSCDLQSLKLQDFVFRQGDVEDPLYAKKRDGAFIMASDCTYANETCFCLAVNGSPYPRKDYDIGLSPSGNYLIVEAGSDKGEELIKKYRMFFKSPSRRDEEARDRKRESVSNQITEFISLRKTPDTGEIKGAVKRTYDNIAMWEDFASTCVECGACNLVCPTCHCFLLYDEKDEGENKNRRVKVWDSCLYKTFARVAGGANPRRHLYERLRNRFDKKFDFFPEVLDYFACTGCGRCIEACPGDIDIREVLKGMVAGTWTKPPHK